MKPIRDYSDGQWLLLLWTFVILFVGAGLIIDSTLVLVVAVLGALTALYTTYLYVAERTGRSGVITVFGRQLAPPARTDNEPRESDSEGGTP